VDDDSDARSHGRARRLRKLALLLGCLAPASCSQGNAPEWYTMPAGAIDTEPRSPFGNRFADFPPEADGSPYDPSQGRGVQAFADDLIGAQVATFVAQNLEYSALSGREFHSFFPPANAGPGFGLCRAKVYTVTVSGGQTDAQQVRGEWQGEVFAVAGSVAPLGEKEPTDYRARLDRACRERRDMGSWYRADHSGAYLAARLADLIVAAAREAGPLPFRLGCRAFPADVRGKALCTDDVRKVAATIDPRAIVRVDSCSSPVADCLEIGLAKNPKGEMTIEDRWTLEVHFSEQPSLRIANVVVHDTQVLIE
jgi:hypothetical protein